MPEGVQDIAGGGRRTKARQPVRHRRPMPHPHFNSFRWKILRHAGKNLAHERQQHLGPLPVRRRFQSGEFHLPSDAQSRGSHREGHFAVGGHHRIARRHARIADHDMIAALRLQRHAIAGDGGELFRVRTRRDHRFVRDDISGVGRHRLKRAVGDFESRRARPMQFRARIHRVADQAGDISAGIAALTVLLHQQREFIFAAQRRFPLPQFVFI